MFGFWKGNQTRSEASDGYGVLCVFVCVWQLLNQPDPRRINSLLAIARLVFQVASRSGRVVPLMGEWRVCWMQTLNCCVTGRQVEANCSHRRGKHRAGNAQGK